MYLENCRNFLKILLKISNISSKYRESIPVFLIFFLIFQHFFLIFQNFFLIFQNFFLIFQNFFLVFQHFFFNVPKLFFNSPKFLFNIPKSFLLFQNFFLTLPKRYSIFSRVNRPVKMKILQHLLKKKTENQSPLPVQSYQ